MNETNSEQQIFSGDSPSIVDPKDISISNAYNIKLTESAEELIADLGSPKQVWVPLPNKVKGNKTTTMPPLRKRKTQKTDHAVPVD